MVANNLLLLVVLFLLSSCMIATYSDPTEKEIGNFSLRSNYFADIYNYPQKVFNISSSFATRDEAFNGIEKIIKITKRLLKKLFRIKTFGKILDEFGLEDIKSKLKHDLRDNEIFIEEKMRPFIDKYLVPLIPYVNFFDNVILENLTPFIKKLSESYLIRIDSRTFLPIIGFYGILLMLEWIGKIITSIVRAKKYWMYKEVVKKGVKLFLKFSFSFIPL